MSRNPKAVVLFAEGFEEVEAITPVDFLRRAGVEVDMVGIAARQVLGSHNIAVVVDYTLAELQEEVDAVLLPGGMPGAKHLSADAEVQRLLSRQMAENRLIAAICASPAFVLGAHGFLTGRRFTCFPGQEGKVTDGTFSEDRVVVDGNIITSRGPGSAAEWAWEIIRQLVGDEAAERVHNSTQQKD